jgi:hypothetical protein
MPSKSETTQIILSLFTEQPCWTIEDLATEVNYSIPSVRRFLYEVGYFSSFTHNGGWYTLRTIPRFNMDGLWFYQNIGFSRAGSLTGALISLIVHSPAGMTADQLGMKLHCRCHAILVQLYRKGKLQRQKAGRSFVYIAGDPAIADMQRQAMAMRSLPAPSPPTEIIVLILVEFIKRPKSSFDQLATYILQKNGIIVSAAQIKRIFEIHGLKKKTKTARLMP